MIVVFIVVLVVFGPQKLPELARGLGKLMAEFRKASTDFRNAFEEEMRDMERQALLAERKKAAETIAAAPAEQSQSGNPSAPDGPTPSENPPTPATAETPSSEVRTGGGAAEAPAITPVAESIPRSAEEPAQMQSESAATTDPQESPQDAQHTA